MLAVHECERRAAKFQMKPADIDFMREAIAEARKGAELGEVPVGAILVRDGKIIGREAGNR